MELSLFNVNHGFMESVIRGFRSGFLGPEDYRRLATSETLEDLRSALEETDYGTFLQDEPSPIMVSTISRKCYDKLADEFLFLKAQTVEPATTIIDFIAREKMIDNVVTIVQGVLNDKKPADMKDKMHPLGIFDGLFVMMADTFDVSQRGFEDIYRIFLCDTPIGPYFDEFLKMAEIDAENEAPRAGYALDQVGGLLDKQDPEVMKATLKKLWLQDFHSFVMSLGGTTAEVLGDILKKEADFRVIMVALNAMNTHLGSETSLKTMRNPLFPNFGYLYPEGAKSLYLAWNEASIRSALESYGEYSEMYEKVKGFYDTEGDRSSVAGVSSIEDEIFKHNVRLYEMSFEQQYHFGIIYSWIKLKEQEIRNIRWIANMIVLKTKDHIDDTIVPIFAARS